MIRYCPNCKQNTLQYIAWLNPDKPLEGEIYVCYNCSESTGVRDQESAAEQLYMDVERVNTIVYGNDPHAAAERAARSDYDEEPTEPDPPHDLQQEVPCCKNCGRVSGIENGQWIGISEDGYCTKCVAWLEDNGRTYNDFTDYLPYE